jgi:ketosteroid isomerase-like protein
MRGEPKPIEVTLDFLDAFAEAWNRHNLDAIMAAMTEDCVFEASAGVGVNDTVYDGRRQVRKASRWCSRSFLTPDGADQSTLSRAIEA